MPNEKKALVVVLCLAYNHGKYIRDALESFVMQKTNFPFVVIVHDDASTDGTADIIREYAERYPDIIVPIFQTENQYTKHDGSIGRALGRERDKYSPKYIAYCEGDDYWIDPLKLRKQVDLMEQNPLVVGCYTSFITVNPNGEKIERSFSDHIIQLSHSGDQFGDLIKTNYIQTCTFLCKSSLLTKDVYRNSPYIMDYSLFLSAAIFGPLIYIPEITAAYRIVNTGMIGTQLAAVGRAACIIQSYFWQVAYSENNPLIHKSSYVSYFWRNAWARKHLPVSFWKLMRNAPLASIGGLLLWIGQFLVRGLSKYSSRTVLKINDLTSHKVWKR